MKWFTSSSSTAAAEAEATKTMKTTSNAGLSSSLVQKENLVMTDAEQLDHLIAGGAVQDVATAQRASFLGSNRRHLWADAGLGLVAYTCSGLQHIHGQSNAITLLTMWTAGTTFLINAAQRKYLQEAMDGALPTAASQVSSASAASSTSTATALVDAAAGSGSTTTQIAASRPIFGAAPTSSELRQMQQNIFKLEAVASLIWMMASLQRFRIFKRLKWCGYSSWMGLGCSAYFSTRHLYNVLVV